MAAPSPRDLRDLALDLAVETGKLDALVALGAVKGDRLRVNAAALRLQSFSTGIDAASCRSAGCAMAARPMPGTGIGDFWSAWGTPAKNASPC